MSRALPFPRTAALVAAGAILASSFAFAQDAATNEALIVQLKDDAQRAAARQQLIERGGAAVPAIAAQLANASDDVVVQLLAILTAIGPQAGAAVPELLQLVSRPKLTDRQLTPALAELLPWRADDVRVEFQALQTDLIKSRFRAGNVTSDTAIDAVVWQRLAARFEFPRHPDIDTLLAVVARGSPLRVELAIEHLGRRGVAATAAVPALRRILERPEPRVLFTDRSLPLHRKTAVAVLAIAPAGEAAELARAVLAGRHRATAAPQPAVPPRAATRIEQLVAELGRPVQREDAVANLIALGTLSAEPTAAVLARSTDAPTIDASLRVLRDLGPLAATAVPQLAASLLELSSQHTAAVLDALAATAPWSPHVLPFPALAHGGGTWAIFGTTLRGEVDGACQARINCASRSLYFQLVVDATSTVAELAALLDSGSVEVREIALVRLASRGESARAVLPAVAAILDAMQPSAYDLGTAQPVDRTWFVRRRAAEVILAAAAHDDPLRNRARAILAEPEPK